MLRILEIPAGKGIRYYPQFRRCQCASILNSWPCAQGHYGNFHSPRVSSQYDRCRSGFPPCRRAWAGIAAKDLRTGTFDYRQSRIFLPATEMKSQSAASDCRAHYFRVGAGCDVSASYCAPWRPPDDSITRSLSASRGSSGVLQTNGLSVPPRCPGDYGHT